MDNSRAYFPTETGCNIRCIPAVESPLSSDVFLIEGEENIYAYDVGSSPAAEKILQNLNKPLVIILSHFHKDHTSNLARLTYQQLYVGGVTRQRLHCGTTLPGNMLTINDGARLEIQRCPSVHEKGSLILNVNREYTLLGDLIYARGEPDKAIKTAMLLTLQAVDTRFFVVSHQRDKIFEKEKLLEIIRKK